MHIVHVVTDLYQPRQLSTFHIIQFGRQNQTSTCNQLPLWLGHQTLIIDGTPQLSHFIY